MDHHQITQTDERRLILRAKEKLEEEEAEEEARERAEAARLVGSSSILYEVHTNSRTHTCRHAVT